MENQEDYIKELQKQLFDLLLEDVENNLRFLNSIYEIESEAVREFMVDSEVFNMISQNIVECLSKIDKIKASRQIEDDK